ncbi:hypothetical protein KX00_2091 [Francisella sp. TX07-6608]|nr:hypothetical protein KX00_2091 [Francisella sp. TX07-6608]
MSIIRIQKSEPFTLADNDLLRSTEWLCFLPP